MAIDTVPIVTELPIEGSPTFRVDAATTWIEMKNFTEGLKNFTIPQMNALSLDVSNKQSQVSNDLNSTVDAKNESVSARNETLLIRDEVKEIEEVIVGINNGISSAISYAVEQQMGVLTVEINKNSKRRKMSEFGITL